MSGSNMGFSFGFNSSSSVDNRSRLDKVGMVSRDVVFVSKDEGSMGDAIGARVANKLQRQKRRFDAASSADGENNASKMTEVPTRKIIATTSVSNSRTNTNLNNNSKRKDCLSSSISGQALPITRGIELMDKEQLQSLVVNLMNEHPQIQSHIHATLESTNFQINKYLDSLKLKFDDIVNSIPYSRNNYYDNNANTLNDYAFVRMKPYILEFLNCLADYVLDNIPPRVDNLHDSLKFLDCCTEMLLKLPRFDMASNNYYYDKCLEQLSYLWCNVIELVTKDLVILVNDEHLLVQYLDKLADYNDKSQGILQRPLQLFKALNLNFSNYVSRSHNTVNPTQIGFNSSFSSSQISNSNDSGRRDTVVRE
ncbi:hypothetical protein TPHA_0C04420 [Tetrapisispora phaffii CBS 4417]|uniref:Tethering factor for nuclear proteasome STS1 n=1 Tax=Tetrapisispora phaffii (strain ATCC 24235 / CBS 4417 / NBRC 1672 / NRRL Y-8282 / UCD 70-5) TaxID=1071381 RepID=G8BQT0_TETPH|nr:hypothetical protein TPHA_0C04420 [Tetrapisispora phaffii CBS 4417]CCE62592.1 hypothetical protein TPHA_0C04420 [Tetrapisispora phaffii CBS 4417]